jgi:hypothetical protein
LLCHLKRSSNWYITRRSGHHHTNTTPEQEQRTRHNTPPCRPHGRGEQAPPLWDVSTSPSSRTSDRRAPRSRETTAEHSTSAPRKTTGPGHSAWGARLFHRVTLLCQGHRYLRPQNSIYSAQPSPRSPQALRDGSRVKTSSTHGPSAPPRQHEPSAQPAAQTNLHRDGTPTTMPLGRARRQSATVARPKKDEVFT